MECLVEEEIADILTMSTLSSSESPVRTSPGSASTVILGRLLSARFTLPRDMIISYSSIEEVIVDIVKGTYEKRSKLSVNDMSNNYRGLVTFVAC